MADQKYLWYALKKNINNEDSIARTIREHVITYQMEKEIADVQVIKDYKIIEEDFPPNSDLLPKKLFRNSKKVQWIRLGNGYYKKIRIVEEKLFKGLIFVKLAVNATKSNNWLFQQITSWVPGTMFLGRKNAPESITEATFQTMAGQFIGKEMPELHQYLVDHKLINDQPDSLPSPAKELTPKPSDDEADWSDFDVVLKDQFEQLFKTNKTEETVEHKRFNDLGIISISDVDQQLNTPEKPPLKPGFTVSEPKPTPSVVNKKTVASDPVVKTPEPAVTTSTPPVNREPIKFQVGDRGWLKKLQIEVEVKQVLVDKHKLLVEFEVFNRVQTITIDPEEIEEIS